MAYIDLRKVGRAGLKEIRRQAVRLKKLGKTGKEIEELTGVRQNRASEIWAAHQREGDISLERKKYGRKNKIEVFFLPPYAPEYHPYEYLNHAVKISAHSVQQPYTAEDLCHKIPSFMRKLQHHPSLASRFFLHPTLSYLYVQK